MSRFFRLFSCFLLAILLLNIFMPAIADERLKGYSAENAYVYLQFGNYPQWIDGGTPEKDAWTWGSHRLDDDEQITVTPSPILWRILKTNDQYLYLLSEYVLLAHPLHIDYGQYRTMGKYFEQTDLCKYLNSTFMNEAFTAEEQTHLLPHESYGKVYLLGLCDFKDAETGLKGGKAAKGWGTEYAIRVTGLFVYSKSKGQHSCYWLRDPSKTRTCNALCTKCDGSIGNLVADRKDEGVRPVIQLAADGLTITGGSGTKDDPYQISYQ